MINKSKTADGFRPFFTTHGVVSTPGRGELSVAKPIDGRDRLGREVGFVLLPLFFLIAGVRL